MINSLCFKGMLGNKSQKGTVFNLWKLLPDLEPQTCNESPKCFNSSFLKMTPANSWNAKTWFHLYIVGLVLFLGFKEELMVFHIFIWHLQKKYISIYLFDRSWKGRSSPTQFYEGKVTITLQREWNLSHVLFFVFQTPGFFLSEHKMQLASHCC